MLIMLDYPTPAYNRKHELLKILSITCHSIEIKIFNRIPIRNVLLTGVVSTSMSYFVILMQYEMDSSMANRNYAYNMLDFVQASFNETLKREQ